MPKLYFLPKYKEHNTGEHKTEFPTSNLICFGGQKKSNSALKNKILNEDYKELLS